MKLHVFNILEFIDHDILHCRWEWFCVWLIYGDYWRETRERQADTWERV